MQESHIWAAKRWTVSGSPALMPNTTAAAPMTTRTMKETLRFMLRTG
jgi:hypothetical protein